MPAPTLSCEAHDEATRITCVDCDAPICPKCLVRTDVGLKCEDCAGPGPAKVQPGTSPSRWSRWSLVAAVGGLVLVVVAVGAVVLSGGDGDGPGTEALPAVGSWEDVPDLGSIRGTASAVRLDDGRVLVAGGGVSAIPLAATELWDPEEQAWTAGAELDQARRGHRGVVLEDGRVLVAGGISGRELLASAEVYDPASDSWQATGAMTVPRLGHTMTLLDDGRVLVVGGTTPEGPRGTGGGQTISPTAGAEIYDPATGQWQEAGTMASVRFEPTATRLQDGRVLVVGGLGGEPGGTSFSPLRSAELYDPAVETFTGAGALAEGRTNHAAVRLQDGSVVIAGGAGGADANQSVASSERYDPSRGGWQRLSPLSQSRTGATLTLLEDGRALIAAGEAVNGGTRRSLATSEVYDPERGSWRSGGEMACPRSEHDTVLLAGGSVLVVAGDAAFPGEAPVARGCVDRYLPGEDSATSARG